MVFLITSMHIFLVKAIDCVKDLITLILRQNLAGDTDVKTSSFGYMCNDLWVLQFNGESDSKRKQRAKIVDHLMMN